MSEYQDRLDAEVKRADRKIKETGERVTAHVSRRGPVTGRASLPNGAITVEVQPGGRLLDIEFNAAAFTMHPEKLAEELVALAKRATSNANAKLHQSVRATVSAEVANSLARLGIAPGAAADEYVDWVDVIRRQRG